MKPTSLRVLAGLLTILAIPLTYGAFASNPVNDEGTSSGDNQESQSNLVPPVAAPDSNATGKVEISKEDNKQEFKVIADRLDTASPPGPFEVWLEDGLSSGVFVKVGDMTLKSLLLGRWELKLEGDGAAPTGLGVPDVEDLSGRGVQVRDTGGVNTYLIGIIGTLGGGTCPPAIPAVKGEMDMQRPASQPDPDAKGRLELSKKNHGQEFEVEAEKLDTDSTAHYAVYLETAVDSGIYNAVGGMVLQSVFKGRWRFSVEGKCEAPPILGVGDVASLTGRRVEVRNAAGNTVLVGPLPALVSGAGQGNFNLKNNLTLPESSPSPKAKGWVRSRYIAKKGQSDFEVRAQNLDNGKTYSLWLETGEGTAVLENLGPFELKGKSGKNILYHVNTKTGQALPFGVFTVAGLKNRVLEIRDGQDTVHLKGTIP